jgi:ParB family chromosome partitioning protein
VEGETGQEPPRRGIGARLAGALRRRSTEPAPSEKLAPEEPTTPDEAAFLEAAVEEFERRLADVLRQAGEDLYSRVERDLAATEARLHETERRLETTISDRLDGAIAEIRVQGDTQLEYERDRIREAAEAPLASIRRERMQALREVEAAASRTEKASEKAAAQIEAAAEKLGMRARRQELKLVREENSKRITAAVARLERQAEIRTEEVESVRQAATSLLGEVDERAGTASAATEELERRLDEVGRRLAETEQRTEETAAMVADAAGRLDRALASAEDAERRVLEISDRVAATAHRIAELGESAEQAAEWEARIAAAVEAEADVARRISDAERRLLEQVDPGSERG